MQILVIHANQYRVGAVGNSTSCETFDFLTKQEANYQASADGLLDLLERISHEGLYNISDKLSHCVDANEKIYELIKGKLRLFYFKTEDDFLIICTTGLIKKSQAVDQKHVKKAIRLKHEYLDAVKQNTLTVIEENENGD
jgi:Phage derived protein Gp49-like (DUF891)